MIECVSDIRHWMHVSMAYDKGYMCQRHELIDAFVNGMCQWMHVLVAWAKECMCR